MRSGSPQRLRVAVVGAGSSGLLLALLLQRQGHEVSLFERAPGLRSEGCGILLVAAGVEAIAAAAVPGLLEALLASGQPVQRFVIRNLRGDTIETSPVARPARTAGPADPPSRHPAGTLGSHGFGRLPVGQRAAVLAPGRLRRGRGFR